VFRRVAAELGCAVADEAIAVEDMTIAGGRQATGELLARGVEFDAIFAYNDLMALGAMHTLTEAGLRVPEDCRIVGCDDIELAGYASPTLSSLRVDGHGLGVLAMQELHRRISDPDAPPEHHIVDVSLVRRGSSQLDHN